MKESNEIVLQSCRPNKDTVECIDFCLENLLIDKKHSLNEHMAGECTYKELIGALLLAEDEIIARRL